MSYIEKCSVKEILAKIDHAISIARRKFSVLISTGDNDEAKICHARILKLVEAKKLIDDAYATLDIGKYKNASKLIDNI